ncbi:MAG: GMC family oxidoreductase [Pseudomonadota bacterium]
MSINAYDYVIIGSGVAGSTLAKELLEADNKTSILMLEAGPVVAMKDRRFWWDYVVSWKKPYTQCYDREGDNPSTGKTYWDSVGSRMMIQGGSTVHWGGWSMRFKPEDFAFYSKTGYGGDWPYGYDDLEKFYCRADRYLHVCGHDDGDPWRSEPYPMPAYPFLEADGEMIEAFEKLDIKPGHMPLARERRCMATGTCKYCPIGARFSGALVIDQLLADTRFSNFTLMSETPVLRLLNNGKKKEVNGVEYLDPQTGVPTSVFGERIVVCAGAYEVPKILKLSKSQHWKHGVGNDTDLVGRYPVSHLFLTATGTKPKNKERWIAEYDFPTLMSRTYDAPKYQENGKIFMMRTASTPDTDIARLMAQGKSRSEIDAVLTGPRQMQLSAFMEEFGQHKNYFDVGEGTTRFGLPRTEIHFDKLGDFDKRAKKNLDRMERVIRTMGYENVTTAIGTQAGHHTCSTARMGNDEKLGVVDEHLKVFGTNSVYVLSNAVLPNCAAVNPTLTLVALAFKLSDHLLGRGA